ncbi:hypothetical protein ACNKHT_19525 [Shigella flexneri]
MRGTRSVSVVISRFCRSHSIDEAANGTLALDVVLDIVFYKVLIALEMLYLLVCMCQLA